LELSDLDLGKQRLELLLGLFPTLDDPEEELARLYLDPPP